MFARWVLAARIIQLLTIGLLVSCAATGARGQGNVVMGFDALMTMNTADAGVTGSNPSFGGYGRFSYNGIVISQSPELGRFGAFEILHNENGDGSGMGFNFTTGDPNSPVNAGTPVSPVAANMFPLLDRSGFGVNFDPAQYVAELVYKPLLDNSGDQLNMTLDTFDGFDSAGLRRAEQVQWNFFGLANPTGTPDADGFYTVRSNGGSLSTANTGFIGDSFMFETAPLPPEQEGDNAADFNDFEAFDGGVLAVPNGARQIHLQTPFRNPTVPGMIEHFAIKSLQIVKINPDPQEVARLDGHSGFSLRFGSPFRRGSADPPINIDGTNYIPSEFTTFANTDQVSRFDQNGFTNIVLKTHDDVEVGGLALYQPPTTQVFDGSVATVDVTARLTEPQGEGQADRIVLVLKDKDGNDTAPGEGGDEYHYDLLLNQFNTSTMTTVSVELGDFTRFQAGEFVNTGDEQLTDFNLYHLGLETVIGIGLVNMEIESIRVMQPAPPGLEGDYNGDGTVDAADYVVWRKNDSANQAGYDTWRMNFGRSLGNGANTPASVPEPASWISGLTVLGGLLNLRRRAQ
jgi:hypothetical protein